MISLKLCRVFYFSLSGVRRFCWLDDGTYRHKPKVICSSKAFQLIHLYIAKKKQEPWFVLFCSRQREQNRKTFSQLKSNECVRFEIRRWLWTAYVIVNQQAAAWLTWMRKSSLAANDAIPKLFLLWTRLNQRPHHVSFTIFDVGARQIPNESRRKIKKIKKKHVIIFISQSRNHFLYSNFISHIEHKLLWSFLINSPVYVCVFFSLEIMVDVNEINTVDGEKQCRQASKLDRNCNRELKQKKTKTESEKSSVEKKMMFENDVLSYDGWNGLLKCLAWHAGHRCRPCCRMHTAQRVIYVVFDICISVGGGRQLLWPTIARNACAGAATGTASGIVHFVPWV